MAIAPLADELEVRIAITPNETELLDGVPYQVAVYFIVEGNVWNNQPNVRQDCMGAFAQFVSTLQSCAGIQIDDKESAVISGEDFSWQKIQISDEWNFANLSYT